LQWPAERRLPTGFLFGADPKLDRMWTMSDAGVPIEPKAIPAEIDRWNWGAFLLNWIWGIGNNTFIALLIFIPVFGLVMPFVLGFKGSKWAWRNGRWDSVAHFKRVQRLWAIWGAVVWIGSFVLFGGISVGTFSLLKHSEAYALGVSKLQASPVAANVLGTPISAGFPFGKISVDAGGSGEAALSFSATGPKAAGTVFEDAIKKDGVWSIRTLRLKVNGSDALIDLFNGTGSSTT
jgi:Cytochrome oxidase complex assembly protein 1